MNSLDLIVRLVVIRYSPLGLRLHNVNIVHIRFDLSESCQGLMLHITSAEW